MLSRIERGPGLPPVRLHDYVDLEVRLVGFSVDVAFQDAMDGLGGVGVARIPPRVLSRFCSIGARSSAASAAT